MFMRILLVSVRRISSRVLPANKSVYPRCVSRATEFNHMQTGLISIQSNGTASRDITNAVNLNIVGAFD